MYFIILDCEDVLNICFELKSVWTWWTIGLEPGFSKIKLGGGWELSKKDGLSRENVVPRELGGGDFDFLRLINIFIRLDFSFLLSFLSEIFTFEADEEDNERSLKAWFNCKVVEDDCDAGIDGWLDTFEGYCFDASHEFVFNKLSRWSDFGWKMSDFVASEDLEGFEGEDGSCDGGFLSRSNAFGVEFDWLTGKRVATGRGRA